MAEETVYRKSPEECQCAPCIKRRQERGKYYPFVEPDFSGPFGWTCPSCKVHRGYLRYKIACSKSLLISKPGFWFFKRWGRVEFRCSFETPHYHMCCDYCSFQWKMLTALSDLSYQEEEEEETPDDSEQEEEEDEEETGPSADDELKKHYEKNG